MDRREAIKWMITAAAATSLLDRPILGADATGEARALTAVGYGTDPNLLKDYKPGDLWPLTFSETQRLTAVALCEAIIPAEAGSPGAVTVGVPDFIDEWISAPYSAHAEDRRVIIEGLAWLDAEAGRRFGKTFAALDATQTTAICDDICYLPKAQPQFATAAQFFKRYRDLTAGGFYTTREGMKDIGYTGNVPLAVFTGPSAEVLSKLPLG